MTNAGSCCGVIEGKSSSEEPNFTGKYLKTENISTLQYSSVTLIITVNFITSGGESSTSLRFAWMMHFD